MYLFHIEQEKVMKEKYRDCSYEDMTTGIGGQSIPQDFDADPYENKYELDIPFSNGYDQSGMKNE